MPVVVMLIEFGPLDEGTASRDRAARDRGSCPGSANTTCHIGSLQKLGAFDARRPASVQAAFDEELRNSPTGWGVCHSVTRQSHASARTMAIAHTWEQGRGGPAAFALNQPHVVAGRTPLARSASVRPIEHVVFAVPDRLLAAE
jgi:hypothetical protein